MEVIVLRLWHWKLIPVLPRQQLLGQWRECCLIAKELQEKGTPNHILVNPVIAFPMDHFISYCVLVINEMDKRGYNANIETLEKYLVGKSFRGIINLDQLFPGWHTDEYLRQCYYNLEEKHDRGSISDEEWKKIKEVYNNENI